MKVKDLKRLCSSRIRKKEGELAIKKRHYIFFVKYVISISCVTRYKSVLHVLVVQLWNNYPMGLQNCWKTRRKKKHRGVVIFCCFCFCCFLFVFLLYTGNFLLCLSCIMYTSVSNKWSRLLIRSQNPTFL